MSNTHMGQPPSNHITLRTTIVSGSGPTEPTDLRLMRINPNGTLDQTPFTVPVGQVLVVTDVDWWYRGGTPGEIELLRISIQKISDPNSQTAFYSALTLATKGDGSATEAMTSGFMVSSEARILISTFYGSGQLQDLVIRGYLCPES